MQYLINMDTIRAKKVPCPQFRVHSSLYANLSSLLPFNYAYRCKPGRYEVLSISFSCSFKQTQGGKGHVPVPTYPSLKYVVFSSWTIVPPPLPLISPPQTPREKEGKWRILLTLVCNSKSKIPKAKLFLSLTLPILFNKKKKKGSKNH